MGLMPLGNLACKQLGNLAWNPSLHVGKCCSHLSCYEDVPQSWGGRRAEEEGSSVETSGWQHHLPGYRIEQFNWFKCCWAILSAKILFLVNLLVIQVLYSIPFHDYAPGIHCHISEYIGFILRSIIPCGNLAPLPGLGIWKYIIVTTFPSTLAAVVMIQLWVVLRVAEACYHWSVAWAACLLGSIAKKVDGREGHCVGSSQRPLLWMLPGPVIVANLERPMVLGSLPDSVSICFH